MSDGGIKQPTAFDGEDPHYGYSDTEEMEEEQQVVPSAPAPVPRTMQGTRQQMSNPLPDYSQQQSQQMASPQQYQQQQYQQQPYQQQPYQQQQYQPQQYQPVPVDQRVTGNMGGRTGAIRESRIKDRPQPKEIRDSSLKIKIELDLEVEVDLYARVKGDVTIGLM